MINPNGVFSLNGILAGTGLLTVQGQFMWNGGYIYPGSVVTVATNGLLALAGGNGHYSYGIITNAGTIQLLNGGGDLYLYGSCSGGIGELVNLPGALVDVQGNNSISYACGTELVVNQGVLRKSGGTGTTYIYPSLTNSGTLDVQTGTVNLHTSGQGSGLFLPEAGATLIFSTTYEVDNGLTGAGTNLLNGGTFTLNGNINGSNVVLNGAYLLASNTVVNGALTWNSGNINAGSVVTVATNGLLALARRQRTYFLRHHDQRGDDPTAQRRQQLVALWQLLWRGIGELVNLPGALVDVQGNNSIYWGCGTELVVNQGVVRKSGGTGTPTFTRR